MGGKSTSERRHLGYQRVDSCPRTSDISRRETMLSRALAEQGALAVPRTSPQVSHSMLGLRICRMPRVDTEPSCTRPHTGSSHFLPVKPLQVAICE
eukprot:6249834-Amphidinium_carterae.1